jgi:hypothetical protein
MTNSGTNTNIKVYSLFGKSGVMEEIKPVEKLPMYCKLRFYGYGMNDTEACIISEPDQFGNYKAVYMSEYNSGYTKLDSYSRPLSAKFGIGMYYYDSLETYTKEEAEKFIALAEQKIINDKAEAERQAQADKAEIESYKKVYSHLTPNPKDEQPITKKNMIAELKKHFGAFKFSVRKRDYTAYYVSWVNGPTVEEVDNVVQKFCDSCSSQCGDFRDSNPSNFTNHFGGFKYIFTDRDQSAEIEALREDFKALLESKNFLQGEDQYYHLQLMHKVFYRTSIPANATNFKMIESEKNCGSDYDLFSLVFDAPEVANKAKSENSKPIQNNTSGIEIVDYSEKSFAVIGDTKPIKDELKKLGGRWNSHLTCGAGWIFSKSKLTEVQELIN